jgi:hypothetical protein
VEAEILIAESVAAVVQRLGTARPDRQRLVMVRQRLPRAIQGKGAFPSFRIDIVLLFPTTSFLPIFLTIFSISANATGSACRFPCRDQRERSCAHRRDGQNGAHGADQSTTAGASTSRFHLLIATGFARRTRR